ncbi:hypothetical protein EVAR_78816_1 [Eumeta japonica]|uniref:Uncharacterized protein n=1 Tax=Eumeta variegata TaxID=151549 RepID=A0A4C1T1K8_EUMVA|nr:hypothetical protein EVAR_78816_1 [Eumeta japonica]
MASSEPRSLPGPDCITIAAPIPICLSLLLDATIVPILKVGLCGERCVQWFQSAFNNKDEEYTGRPVSTVTPDNVDGVREIRKEEIDSSITEYFGSISGNDWYDSFRLWKMVYRSVLILKETTLNMCKSVTPSLQRVVIEPLATPRCVLRLSARRLTKPCILIGSLSSRIDWLATFRRGGESNFSSSFDFIRSEERDAT